MKHMKLFEKLQHYYIFDYYIVSSNEHNYYLFPDLQSCQLYFLDIVNEERKDLEGDDYDDETMFFTDVKNASNWYFKNFTGEIEMGCEPVTLKDKYVPSEELKLKIDLKKYNL